MLLDETAKSRPPEKKPCDACDRETRSHLCHDRSVRRPIRSLFFSEKRELKLTLLMLNETDVEKLDFLVCMTLHVMDDCQRL